MKPVLEYLRPEAEESFFAKGFDLPYFGTPWHYHPEFELVMIVKSNGKRFIGNFVSDFQDGDITFLGPNLPHFYRNGPSYYKGDPAFRAHSIVIHFLEDSLGKDLLALPQVRKLRHLFERSQQGIDILGDTKKKVCEKMMKLLQLSGMKRLICLLEILELLADTTEYKLISGPGIVGNNALDTDRLNSIFQFVLENYTREITLEEVANKIHMTRTSFCRFFKERTKRTFSSLLMDVRLNQAAKLLMESKESIVQISYECGYSNLSNFNRQFKGKHNMSPREYRQTYKTFGAITDGNG
ncbi:MAG TPA: AraC family transcriptional regulator [Cytophagaceae bacterium]|jgi:AraC-like DNA-binding protein